MFRNRRVVVRVAKTVLETESAIQLGFMQLSHKVELMETQGGIKCID